MTEYTIQIETDWDYNPLTEEYVCKLAVAIPMDEHSRILREYQSPQKLFGESLGERWGRTDDHGRTYYSIFSDKDLTNLQIQVRDAKISTTELLGEVVARNIKRSRKCVPLKTCIRVTL